MQRQPVRGFESQRGAVLIVALVLLLVLTVLGTASVRDTTMAERMAGNFRDYSVALDAAETALRVGELAVADTATFTGMSWGGHDGTYEVVATSTSLDPHTVGNYGRTVPSAVLTDDDGNQLVYQLPEYYIEQLPEIPLGGSDISGGVGAPVTIHYYRVTAKGYGLSPNSEVILQSTLFDWNGNGN